MSEDAILAESVSIAMMLVLETLNPTERAVFVLHEVFGYTHAEVAESIGKTEVAVRQIAHRAREHVQARRRKFQPDSADIRAVVERFLHATHTGDVRTLMESMAPDVMVISDGGGKVTAARKPVVGLANVTRFTLAAARVAGPDPSYEFATYNGLPAVRFLSRGALDWVLAFELGGGLITGLYGIRNPDKLLGAETPYPLTRKGSR